MQVVRKDDVSIYNLTRGKQLPSWLSDRKRRKLQQEDTEIQVSRVWVWAWVALARVPVHRCSFALRVLLECSSLLRGMKSHIQQYTAAAPRLEWLVTST